LNGVTPFGLARSLGNPRRLRATVAAAALASGSAATGVHVFKTLQSFDGAAEDIILSVRVVGELALGYNWLRPFCALQLNARE
jgi:hypothetical protein